VHRIAIVYKTKLAWNQILSNFAFLGYIDPTHRLGARKVAWNQIPSNFAFLGHIDPTQRLGASMHAR